MKTIILTIVILLVGCNLKENEQKNSNTFNKIDSCILNVSSEYADSMILNNAKQFNKTYSQNDSCYLIFLDKLLLRSCDSKNQEKLLIIDSLYRISDGYVGEYFADYVGIYLFENCFDILLEYISRSHQTSLLDLVKHSLVYNIEFSKRYDKQSILNKLNIYLKNELNVEYKGIISSIIKSIK